MSDAAEPSPELDPAALFRQWLAGFGAAGEGTPWESLRALGAALLAAGPQGNDGVGELPGMSAALRELLRDFRTRLDWLIDLPELPPGLPTMPSFPMLGPAREWQIAFEAVGRAWQTERAAAAALQRADWRVLSRGLAGLEAAVAEGDAMPATLVELHGLLVAQCEAAHQEALREDAYVAAFGAHANAALGLRRALSALVERGMPALGLPKTSELQALEARMAALESRFPAAEPPSAKTAGGARRRRAAD